MADARPIPDAEQRRQALDITRSWIVEAPAGSGKTGLLIQRYLKLLASETVSDPGEVLAITFTRKATAEMQERVLAQLTAARDDAEPANPFDRETRPLAEAVLARDAQLGWLLTENPRSLRIRTIDSVAAEIARGLPILSGSGGGQSPADDASALHDEAAHRTLMLLGGANAELSSALATLLLHRDGNLADCEALIANMLATRDQWGELVPLATPHLTEHYLDTQILPRLERALERAICRALTRLTEVVPAPVLTRLCTLAAEMAEAEGYKGGLSPIAICKGRYGSPADRAEDLEHWRALIHVLVKPSKPRDWRKSVSGNHIGFEILKHHQAELKQIIAEIGEIPGLVDELCGIDALPPAHYPPEQWHVTKALFRVLSRALVELQFVFSARGECDFAELGLLARTALRRDSALDDLRTAAGMSLQHLLVDEMQDTSSAQYELIQLLTQRWDGGGQTVFLVGDPKQSIYLFRQARVERFVRTQHLARLGDVPLGTLHLTANFRSQQTLVEAFNQDFATIFPPPPTNPGAPGLAPATWEGAPQSSTPAETVPFRPAHAMRLPTTARARVWHAEALPYADAAEDRATLRIAKSRDHATLVRTVAASWRAAHPASSIAVLVRSRTHLLEIVKALKALPDPIPYRAVEIEPLAERQEILDLLALTRALLHPGDRTAWLAILRAPWCGLGLADLHTLAGEDDPTLGKSNLVELLQTRGDLLSPDGIARLEPFWSVIEAALSHRGTLPLARLVERTWRAFAAPEVLPPEALSNAAHYFELLSRLEQQPGPLHLDTLHERLAELYAAPATHPGAVDLMTIHKSKGLEWDVVFVPALEKTGRNNTGQLLSWLEIDAGEAEDVAHGILAPIQARGAASHQLTTWMRSIESAREAAERKRLFYVACTRAREELHLFAAPALSSKGELKPKTDSLLHSAWPAAEPHIELPEPASGVLDSVAAGTVLRFPTPGMPQEPQAGGEVIVESASSPNTPNRIVQRIPRHLLPTHLTPTEPSTIPQHFPRPEGSFAARTFGNATHAFLDQLTRQRAQGASPEALLQSVPGWSPRIAAVLRSGGLAPAHLQRDAAAIQRALAHTLTDPEGLWLLAPHAEARSESSLATETGNLRLDRTFLAGPQPNTTGNTHLWIVDYKTGTHAQTGLQTFLAEEKAKYRPQLETYARALSTRGLPIRVALYYPLLPALLWWVPEGTGALIV